MTIFLHVHAGAICVPVGARHVVVEKLDDFGAQVATVWDVDAATSWNQSMLRLPTHQMQQHRIQFFENFFGQRIVCMAVSNFLFGEGFCAFNL